MSGFLDTGEVVCYLSGDSFELAEEVAQIIDTEDELQLTDVVLAETAWCLRRYIWFPGKWW